MDPHFPPLSTLRLPPSGLLCSLLQLAFPLCISVTWGCGSTLSPPDYFLFVLVNDGVTRVLDDLPFTFSFMPISAFRVLAPKVGTTIAQLLLFSL